jgi:hypothetical protein
LPAEVRKNLQESLKISLEYRRAFLERGKKEGVRKKEGVSLGLH